MIQVGTGYRISYFSNNIIVYLSYDTLENELDFSFQFKNYCNGRHIILSEVALLRKQRLFLQRVSGDYMQFHMVRLRDYLRTNMLAVLTTRNPLGQLH